MKYLKKFSESFDPMGSWNPNHISNINKEEIVTKKDEVDNILSIKVKCTNTENINPTKLPDLEWLNSEFWIRECLEQLIQKDKSIKDGDILCIGANIYDKSIVKIQSIIPLKFDLDSKKYFNQVKTKFNNNMREVFLKPNIEFTFDNKYNLLKLFSEKYPELYKKLNNRYNSIEYGGNMVDFTDEFVKYSEWNFDDESGTEKKVCRIEDLIK
jgi:hypothetical protein